VYEKFAASLQIRQADDIKGSFTGIASLFGSVANGIMPTRFENGSFKDTLSARGSRPIKLLWQHDQHEPIGSGRARETHEGLEIAGSLVPTARGKDAMVLAKSGLLELSVGFTARDWEMHGAGQDRVRLVKKADLHEVSLVTFGADPGAQIREVHELASSGALGAAAKAALERDPSLEGLLAALGLEQHAGRILSGKNLARLRDSVKFLIDMHVEADGTDAFAFYTDLAKGLKPKEAIYMDPHAEAAAAAPAGEKPGDKPDDKEPDDDADECPECGEAMKGGKCEACGYTKPAKEEHQRKRSAEILRRAALLEATLLQARAASIGLERHSNEPGHPFYGNQYTGGQGGSGKDEGGSGKLPKGDTEVAGLPAQVTPNGNGLDVRVGLDGNMSGRTISLVNTWMETPNLNTTFGAFEDKGKARDVVDKLAEHAHALGKSELQLASGREGDRGFSREDKDFGLWLKDSGGRAGIRLDKDQSGFWAVKVNLKQYLASAKKGK